MAPRSTDEPTCPVCGQPFDERVVVARGDGWSDIFAGTPFSFFKRYQRRCTSRRDVEADATRGEGERVLYFHEGHDRHSLL